MISDLHRIRFDVHKQYWRGVERLFGSLLAIVDGQNCAIQCISGDIRTVLGNFKSVFCTNVYIYINIVFFLQCIYIYVYICIVELCRFRSVCNNKNIRFFLSINWWFEIKVYMWFLASCCLWAQRWSVPVEFPHDLGIGQVNLSPKVDITLIYVDGVIPNMITWNQI